jgi:hypothetical protein
MVSKPLGDLPGERVHALAIEARPLGEDNADVRHASAPFFLA